MARKEYIAELRTRKIQITAELDHINQILDLEDAGEPVVIAPHTSNGTSKKVKKETLKPVGVPKGSLSWEAYWPVVLKAIGGRGKAQNASEYAIKANPKIKPTLIRTSARTKLSKLFRKKKIGAVTGNVRSEGYEFFILKPEAADAQQS